MTTRITRKTRKPVELDAAGMVSKIRQDVQSFISSLSGVQRDTQRLAPLVAEAYVQYKKENTDGTKLLFFKLFATEEQAKSWPETDLDAKAPGAPTQALFNGMEYLLRKAGQMAKAQEIQETVEKTVREAEANARKEGKLKHLKGADLDNYVTQAREAALATLAGPQASRMSQDELVEAVYNGWYADLEDWEVFSQFVASMLLLKYSETTVTSIINKASDRIKAEQEQVETPPAEQPAAAATQTPGAAIPFRRHIAAA